MCVRLLLLGGTSRSQLDEAAATAAELGLELAPVELQYTTAFDMGSMSFRVVDPSVAADDAFHVKAEVRFTALTVRRSPFVDLPALGPLRFIWFLFIRLRLESLREGCCSGGLSRQKPCLS